MGQSWESKFGSADPGFPGFAHRGHRTAGDDALGDDDVGQGDLHRSAIARRDSVCRESPHRAVARGEIGGAAAAGEPPISRILQDPQISDWLQQALRDALSRDPDEVLRDLKSLELVIRARAQRQRGQAPFSWLNLLVW